MEIKKFIKYKGKKYPFVNTPLSRKDIWFLRDNYDRFITYDISRGTTQFYSGEPIRKNYTIDFSFKHIFYAVSSFYAIWQFYKTKRKAKRIVEKYVPNERNVEEFKSTLDGWEISQKEKPKVADA